MLWRVSIILGIAWMVLLSSIAVAGPEFEAEVAPLLKTYCYQCHGDSEQKGEVRLDTLSTDLISDRRAAETWHDALDSILFGEMPPEDEDQPTSEERAVITDWIEASLAAAAKNGSTGEIVMRRLNRDEYAYTMEDLLGFKMDYTQYLPSDSLSTDGFLNNGAALKMSGMQLETFLKTARRALGYVIVEGEQPSKKTKQFNPKFKARGKLPPGENRDRLGRNHYWSGSIDEMPRSGEFTIQVTARAEKNPESSEPILHADYGYFVRGLNTTFLVELGELPIISSEAKVYEFKGRSELFPQPDALVEGNKISGIVLLHNALKDGVDPPKAEKQVVEPDADSNRKKKRKKMIKVYPEDPDFPKVIIEKVEFIQNDYALWPPPIHTQIVPLNSDLASAKTIESILQNFLEKAWRRPVQDKELSRWLNYYQSIAAKSESPIDALREILALALTSNQFLYLAEPQIEAKARKLNGYELASRLSYFLWSSMPDEALFTAAGNGTLINRETLKQQFDRMIKDHKFERFIDQFTQQWLDLGALNRVAINPQFYDDFDEGLKPLMRQETQEFFSYILHQDLSSLQLLGADFTMANKRLASHYGLEGPIGSAFEKVSLIGTNRIGGLLGHGSTHMSGSDGAHTHPIKRAVWIRERLLHDPPKPPPPNVPTVEDAVPNFAKLTIREQLKIHREKEACADCHKGIDPWGIAMEQFDAVGLERTKIARSKKDVDAKAQLPGGFDVNGIRDLQHYLVTQQKDQFAHALTAKLLTYALGRSLTFADDPLIEELTEKFEHEGYKLKPLMKYIITSPAFLSR